MAANAGAALSETGDFEDDFDFGEDTEIIAPKVDLRRKAKERRSKPGDIDPIAAAEAAMAEMSGKFAGWMQSEADSLVTALEVAEMVDFTDESRTELFARSHDIKGQAMTLGFPAAGRTAASLCRLLELVKETDRLPRELVRQHALAIKAISRESQQNEANPVADKLATRLTEVTDDYIASIA